MRLSRLTILLGLMLVGLVLVSAAVDRGRLAPAQNSSAQSKQASETGLVREYLEGMQKLRGTDLSPEARAQLTQQLAQKRAQLRDLRRQTRLANGILPFGTAKSGGSKKVVTTPAGDSQKLQTAEKCTSCQYIWKQIELDVVNPKFIQTVQASFEKNCLNAQKATVYYEACEDMYDDLYAMTDDYTSSSFDGPAICTRAGFCAGK